MKKIMLSLLSYTLATMSASAWWAEQQSSATRSD